MASRCIADGPAVQDVTRVGPPNAGPSGTAVFQPQLKLRIHPPYIYSVYTDYGARYRHQFSYAPLPWWLMVMWYFVARITDLPLKSQSTPQSPRIDAVWNGVNLALYLRVHLLMVIFIYFYTEMKFLLVHLKTENKN